MTVTPRKTADGMRWRYDFKIDGVRYASKAIYKNKREAGQAEKAKRGAVERGEVELPLQAAPAAKVKGGKITLDQACREFYNDIGQHHRSAKDIERRLGHCKRLIGADKPLSEIRFAVVNEAVQARRKEKNARGELLSNGGVNRDIIDQLRPVLRRAEHTHELELPRINWKDLRLKEAGELVCEYTDAEIAAWLAQLIDPAERLYLATALTYGPRRGELYFDHPSLELAAADGPELSFGRYLNREGVWRETRKDGSLHTVALDPLDAAALDAQRAKAIDAGAPHIWVDVAGQVISYYAMGWRIRQAAKRAGIIKARIIHGARHHAATAIMRANEGSLVLAQTLLGHKQIATTKRYAHVSKGDQKAAIAKRGRVSIPTQEAVTEATGARKPRAKKHAQDTPAFSR